MPWIPQRKRCERLLWPWEVQGIFIYSRDRVCTPKRNDPDSLPVTQQGRKRGTFMGHIYKRGAVYWIKYHKNGKPYYESSRSKKESDAKRLLKKREGEISDGKLPGIFFDRVKFDELAEDFLRDYRINQKKSLDKAERSVNHLKKRFEGFPYPR